jgi:hypothetical protein
MVIRTAYNAIPKFLILRLSSKGGRRTLQYSKCQRNTMRLDALALRFALRASIRYQRTQ